MNNKVNIGVLNYGVGNVGSVYSALCFYGYNVCMINNKEGFNKSDILVLAGVGNFSSCSSKLKGLNLWDELHKNVLSMKKPILGICLGMHLFSDFSWEFGKNEGFGWIKGEVVKLDNQDMKVPHIGWNKIFSDDRLFNDMKYSFFYFMHSYHLLPNDKNVVIATTKYAGKDIVSAVRKDNIYGVQFHPEKSQADGLRFLKNVVESIKC